MRIREASGVIAVPNNHKINLRPRNGGQKPLGMGSYTFYYEVLSPCEKVITYQEAKLTVKELVDFVPKTTIKVCNPNVTLAGESIHTYTVGEWRHKRKGLQLDKQPTIFILL